MLDEKIMCNYRMQSRELLQRKSAYNISGYSYLKNVS